MAIALAWYEDVPGILQPPAQRTVELTELADFARWDSLYQTIRDTVNKFIEVVHLVTGIDLAPLQEGGLADLIIKPLTGDWNRIKMNGDACKIAGNATIAMGTNIAFLPVNIRDSWEGSAEDSFVLTAETFGVIAGGLGGLMSCTYLAFDLISQTSEALGRVVMRILNALFRLLERVAAKIASRFGGWWAAIKTGLEIVAHGLEPVIDIYNGIKMIIKLVQDTLDLVDAAREWVDSSIERVKEAFAAFEQFGDIFTQVANGQMPTRAQMDAVVSAGQAAVDKVRPGQGKVDNAIQTANGTADTADQMAG